MAPARLPPCKVCSTKSVAKYRCPHDGVDYCSVACFKKHKATDCAIKANGLNELQQSTVNPDSQQSEKAAPLTSNHTEAKLDVATAVNEAPSSKRQNSNQEDDYDSLKPHKRLEDLSWPVEPSPGLWLDPLSRDDVKPLRGFEFEAVATDPRIRSLLGDKSLRTTLQRLSELKDGQSKQASLRLLLGLTNVASVPTHYRPGVHALSSSRYSTGFGGSAAETSGAGRGERGNSGRGGRGMARGGIRHGHRRGDLELLSSTPEERSLIVKFVEAVQQALTGAREAKGERV
ncbi:hypothetical protein ACM66B_001808 [Microbotryomycetes sp. NB124-2]